MSHRILLEYIHAARSLGADDTEITARLSSIGWYHVDIQDALRLHRIITVAAPAVLPTPPATPEASQGTARTYDPRIIAIAALSFAFALLAFFIFFR